MTNLNGRLVRLEQHLTPAGDRCEECGALPGETPRRFEFIDRTDAPEFCPACGARQWFTITIDAGDDLGEDV